MDTLDAFKIRFDREALALTPTPDVFLCHSSKDKPVVKRLATDLERLGITPWFDAWEIGPGDSLIDKIGAGLDSSKFFCVLLSKNSVTSKWCSTELRDAIYRATDAGTNNIIPLKCGDVEIPVFLRDKLYVNMTKYSFRGLLEVSARIYGISPKEVSHFIDGTRKIDISSISDFIIEATRERRIKFGNSDWQIITQILRQKGIDISDTIDIIDRRTGKIHFAC